MPDYQKTVFISYRQDVTGAHAHLIYLKLTELGYDVFFDYQSLNSGEYEPTIFSQILEKAHFLVLLRAGTLPRCKDPNDLFRREIEYAIEFDRNIVPVLVSGFTFSRHKKHLIGDLSKLANYQAITYSHELLEAFIDRLDKFLTNAKPVKIYRATPDQQAAAEEIIRQVATEPPPTKEKLSAEDYVVRAFEYEDEGNIEAEIEAYSEALRLNPFMSYAFNNRGGAYMIIGEFKKAVADYNKSIELDPQSPSTYINRGYAYRLQGDFKRAIADFDKAIQLDPRYVTAYESRGATYHHQGKLEQALADWTVAVHLIPNKFRYSNRAEILFSLRQPENALADFEAALKLDRKYRNALAGRAISLHAMGKVDEAKAAWRELVSIDEQYVDSEWVGSALDWRPELIEEARRLIAAW